MKASWIIALVNSALRSCLVVVPVNMRFRSCRPGRCCVCWTQERYEIYQVGITQDRRLADRRERAATLLEKGDTENLSPAPSFPTRPARALLLREGRRWNCSADARCGFPCLARTFGEDGTMQGLLEMADLAYVGAGVTGSSVGMDKGIFKDVMRANKIPTVESVIVLRSEIEKDMKPSSARRKQWRLPTLRQTCQPGFIGRHHQMPQSC